MQTKADTPIACSLPTGALEQRLAWIRRVTASSLLSHQLEGTSLRLRYREEALPDLQKIIAQERECCPFLEYSLRPAEGAVQLTIDAPGGLASDARWLFEQFLPQAASVTRKSCGCAPGACG